MGTVIKEFLFLFSFFIFLNALYSWGVLNIASGAGKTNSLYSDQTIMFAAGYLEGALTAG